MEKQSRFCELSEISTIKIRNFTTVFWSSTDSKLNIAKSFKSTRPFYDKTWFVDKFSFHLAPPVSCEQKNAKWIGNAHAMGAATDNRWQQHKFKDMKMQWANLVRPMLNVVAMMKWVRWSNQICRFSIGQLVNVFVCTIEKKMLDVNRKEER